MSDPQSPAEVRLSWITSKFDSGGRVSPDEIESQFAPAYLDKEPVENVQRMFEEIASRGSFRISETQDRSRTFWRGLGLSGDERVFVGVQVERDDPHRLLALIVQPARNYIQTFRNAPKARARSSMADVVAGHAEPFAQQLPAGGVVVGVTRGDDGYVGCFGDVHASQVFEIGSMTKTITGTLLAEMIERGDVGRNDAASSYFPPEVRFPVDREGNDISLLHLVTHSSGLPHLPPDFAPANLEEPYADATPEKLDTSLGKIVLHDPVGSRVSYSSLGFSVLGRALAHAGGSSFETLLLDRVFTPLGMRDSGVVRSPEVLARAAQGHALDGSPVPHWDYHAFVPTGGIHTTISDLIAFIRAELDPRSTSLHRAIVETHIPRVPIGRISHFGFGWRVTRFRDGSSLIWHLGRTGGFTAGLIMHPATKTGGAVLTNSTSTRLDLLFEIVGSLTGAR